jgi:hypothetical protein
MDACIQPSGFEFNESPLTGLSLSDLAAPGIKTGRMDMVLAAIIRNDRTARLLFFDNALPMVIVFFDRHDLPPGIGCSSFLESYSSKEDPVKMGSKDAYDALDKALLQRKPDSGLCSIAVHQLCFSRAHGAI